MSTYSYTGVGGQNLGGHFEPPATAFTPLDSEVTVALDGTDLRVSWSTPFQPGTWYQLYQDSQLMWWGQSLFAHIPYITENVVIVIAAVPAQFATTSFSSRLPRQPLRKIKLTWYGGYYLGQFISGFNVYMGPAPGAAIDYTKPMANVPSYASNMRLDGYGRGGYGRGGYGSAATIYTWESEQLASGLWNCGIKSVDTYGNESTTADECQVRIIGPPEPPAKDSAGIRLHYTYNPSTHQATLTWLASPSAA